MVSRKFLALEKNIRNQASGFLFTPEEQRSASEIGFLSFPIKNALLQTFPSTPIAILTAGKLTFSLRNNFLH